MRCIKELGTVIECARYLYRGTKRGQQYKLGLDVVYVSGSKLVLNNYHILEYDKDIYKNLDYISGAQAIRFVLSFVISLYALHKRIRNSD
jgi:hypothetical protein